MRAAIAALTAQLGQVSAQLAATEQQRAQDQLDLARLRERVAATAAGAQHTSRLIDTRGLGRPTPFKGNAVEFPAWVFKVENFLEAAHDGARGALQWVQEKETIQLRGIFIRQNYRSKVISDGKRKINKFLFHAISSFW